MASRSFLNGVLRHWYFWIAMPLVVAIEAAFVFTLPWNEYPRAEWAVLFDLCVFLPALHLIVYRKALSRRALLIRTVAIAGLGLWLSRYLVPAESQQALLHLAKLHGGLVGVVIVFELGVMMLVIRAAFARDADPQRLERDFAVPPLIARLMVWEARFWRALAGWFSGRK
ncbi:hypothetical protein [Altererythrobacter sp. C41]|uniref:hypothetical protein n=1 Tax=Altererythrobacter sp. C41 TaxID=2806021 RepID=UPI001934B074|nr:hypothetical protein [Altererythrobacter sp. C41]MBM0171423.1 hypothetical protein [Altererythrobacter sp. C41]